MRAMLTLATSVPHLAAYSSASIAGEGAGVGMGVSCGRLLVLPVRRLGPTDGRLRPGGRLMLCSLARHEHRSVIEPYGHANLGFTVDELSALAERAGLVVDTCKIITQEKRPPHFEVVSLLAHHP